MRILYVALAYKPAFGAGGPVVSVAAAAERLAGRGHQVTVLTTTADQHGDLDVPTGVPLMVDGVEVYYFRRTEPLKRMLPFVGYLARSFGYMYSPALKRALAERVRDFDLVHTQYPYIYPTHMAARAAFAAGKPLFYHQRGAFDPAHLQFRSAKKRVYIAAVERPIMRRATTLFALTDAERESYRALRVTTPCRVIPNGVEVPVQSATDRRAGADADDRTSILFLGRLHPLKGADLALEAFLRIADQFPKAVLVMAGPDEFGIERQFREQAAAAGLGHRVMFPGMVTGEAKRELLARADLFCLPSVGEGFSLALLEAMAHGTPVMISPGCHFPEVEASGAGWIVDRSVDAWVGALAGALKSRGELRCRGEAARNLVRRAFTWDSVVDRLEEAYREGVARHRKRHHTSRGTGAA